MNWIVHIWTKPLVQWTLLDVLGIGGLCVIGYALYHAMRVFVLGELENKPRMGKR